MSAREELCEQGRACCSPAVRFGRRGRVVHLEGLAALLEYGDGAVSSRINTEDGQALSLRPSAATASPSRSTRQAA
jgi:hypothetical protein